VKKFLRLRRLSDHPSSTYADFMKEQILALEATDDLHTVRDKIARAQAGRLVVIWSALEQPLRRRLDLVLMKRWAAMAGAELAIVSTDEEIRRLAHRTGIPCHPSLTASALAGLSTRPSPAQSENSFQRGRRPPDPLPPGRRSRPIPPALRIGLFSAAILSIAVVFLLLLPSARVRVPFPSRKLESSVAIDPSICDKVALQLSISDRRATTGRILAPTAYAEGAVTLTNTSNRLLNVSAGLRVASENGIIFETLDGLILPPGKSLSASVRAVAPGPSANLAPGGVNRVLGPLALSLTATNPKATSGGAETWRNSVSAADLESLRIGVSSRARAQAENGFLNLIYENRSLVENSLHIEFDPQNAPDLPLNTPADSVGMTIHAVASMKACPSEGIPFLAEQSLGAQVQPGEILLRENLLWRLSENPEGGVDLAASGMAARISDRNAMALALRLQTPARAASILLNRFHAVAVPTMELRPAWIPWLPLFPYQIEILAAAD
jgi:hypothetical protein